MKSLTTLIFIILKQIIVQGLFHEHSQLKLARPYFIPKQSLFGYSLAYQNHSLLVSDPIAEGVGTVYFINLDAPYENSSVASLSIKELKTRRKVLKHDFWFGASVIATEKFSLACAPRYAEPKTIQHKKVYANVGVCFVKLSNDPHQLTMKAMSRKDRQREVKERDSNLMDSFGWSVHITSENEVLIGGPAMSKGRVIKHHTATSSDDPKLFYKISVENPVLYNFGYSISSGNFFGPEMTYAVSTTFGSEGFGKVYLFNSKLDNIGAINDNKLSTMFGATLCSVMLSRYALIVGAPVYTDGSANEFDVGAVYIYMADTKISSNEMFLKQKIKGKSNGGYFGISILKLGDLDGDSQDEVAIAAPYEDGGKGTIYIYTGKGLLKGEHSQKIQMNGFKYFGFSMTTIKDYDGNGCNEIAISSPFSDNVVVLKSIASITVKLRAVFPENITIGKYFEFDSCIDVSYPKTIQSRQEFETDLLVSVTSTFSNATFHLENIEKSTLTYNQPIKMNKDVYCKKIGVTTKSTQEIEHDLVLAYKIIAQQKENPMHLDDFKISRVLVSENSKLILEDKAYTNICESGRCVPNLALIDKKWNISTPYVIGSTSEEKISLTINNSGDPAYGACLLITLVNSLFIRYPSECSLQSSNKLSILCKPITTIRNNENWTLDNISIDTTSLTSLDDTLDVKYNLYCNCNDNLRKSYNDSLLLISDTNEIFIARQAIPEEFVNMTFDDIEFGKTIQHLYTIHNNGKTNWINVTSEILIQKGPLFTYTDTPITITTGSSFTTCNSTNTNQTETNMTVTCAIGDLRINNRVTVAISINTSPKTIGIINDNENDTVSTKITLFLKKQLISSSISTVVSINKSEVPLWILIVSSLIGLIIVSIIGYILYMRGFLRRKKKAQLKRLKSRVSRQSMLRTAMCESIRASTQRNSSEEVSFLCSQNTLSMETNL